MTIDPFFNRELELAELETAWSTPGAALVTLWGRRRVGKSTLLSHFAAGKRSVYLYGTRLTERDILADLALQAADVFDDSYLRSAPFPTWDAALDYLAGRARDERLLVIFDEFPYLCEVTGGLDTLVQRWWDRVHQSAQLMLVLAGSGFSFMEGLTGAGHPPATPPGSPDGPGYCGRFPFPLLHLRETLGPPRPAPADRLPVRPKICSRV
jgi:AAA+ ATPase superfamily predicted ATPase